MLGPGGRWGVAPDRSPSVDSVLGGGFFARSSGVGTLCIAISDECPAAANMGNITSFGGGQVLDVDLSDPSTQVPFSLDIEADLVSGDSYVVSGFLTEAGGDCPAEGPAQGDPVAFGADSCPPFVYQTGQDVADVVVGLSMSMPF